MWEEIKQKAEFLAGEIRDYVKILATTGGYDENDVECFYQTFLKELGVNTDIYIAAAALIVDRHFQGLAKGVEVHTSSNLNLNLNTVQPSLGSSSEVLATLLALLNNNVEVEDMLTSVQLQGKAYNPANPKQVAIVTFEETGGYKLTVEKIF